MFYSTEIEGYKSFELLAKQVVEGFITGLHKSPFHGFSVEFAEHKIYNRGDSTKNIDWKLYGRTDKLFTKSFEEETNLRCQILLDVSPSMYFPEIEKVSFSKPLQKIAFGVLASAVLMELFRKQRDAFGLTLFSDAIEYQSQTKSSALHKAHLFQILEQKLQAQKTGQARQTTIVPVLHSIAEQIHKRSLVIIFTDAFSTNENVEDILKALQHLRHSKHEVLLFHVFDKQKEFDFNYPNRPFHFIDKETDQKIKLQPSEIKDSYHKAVSSMFAEIKKQCENMRIDYVQADINEGFNHILRSYLLKRKKLY